MYPMTKKAKPTGAKSVKFLLRKRDTEDSIRQELKEKVMKEYPVKKAKKSTGDPMSICGDSDYAYVGEITPISGGVGKAIIERGGKKFGVEFLRDTGTNELSIRSYTPVEQQWASVEESGSDGDGMADDDEE